MSKKKPQDPFHGAKPSPLGTTELEVNGLHCTFNMPLALTTKKVGREEVAQSLPPYAPQLGYKVDDLDGCPDGWMRSGKGASSYVVGVKTGHGMWLDFNANRNHTHDVAILISIQGVNALTAAKVKGLELRKHEEGERCPYHIRAGKKPYPRLGADRHCPKCAFKLPPQNYLATTGTPFPYLWLDGFRAKDGEVRQFVFTEDTARGIAAQVIGESRVQALGIAFYLSKKPKPKMYHHYGRRAMLGGGLQEEGVAMNAQPTSIEVAAGAKIDQNVYADPKPLDYWQESPAGVLYINYVGESDLAKLTGTKPPKKPRPDKDALSGLVTGNDPE